LEEITKAYLVFANGGKRVAPIYINKIEDRNGRIIEENHAFLEESISEETAAVMTDLLKAVIQEGTGWRAKALKRPAAGKTGTTNDLRDAWFIGFTPRLVAGVWVGYDDRRLLASPYSEKTVFQAFREGQEPIEHTPKPKSAKTGQFSQFDMEISQ
jgi:penicillin-binding protein 1A